MGSGSAALNRSVTLKQIHYDLLADVPSMFELDGQTKTFYVRSNSDWKASIYYNGGVNRKYHYNYRVANTNQGTLFTFKATPGHLPYRLLRDYTI